MLVDVEIGGVDDADGADGFRLDVPGGAARARPDGRQPLRRDDGPACEPCTLAFRLGDDAGSSRVLLYQRGDERVRWDLSE